MSAGSFVRSRYESDVGNIHPIRVQPETLAATLGSANAAPTGGIDLSISAKVSGSSRSLGLTARKVRVVFTGTPPTGYKAESPISIPILTKSVYDGIAVNSTGTYLGAAVEVIGKTGESSR